MKKYILLQLSFLLLFFNSYSQITYTATVTHNSCLNEGIVHVEIITSPVQPPYTVFWTIGQNYGYGYFNPVTVTVNSNSFDLVGLPPGYINIYINPELYSNNYNDLSVFIPLPFTFDVVSTPGTCPPLIPATVEALNLTGGVAPFTFELYSVPLPTVLPVYPSDTFTNTTGHFDSILFNGVMDLAVTDANGCRVSLLNMRDSLIVEGPTFQTSISSALQDCHTGSISLTPSGTTPYQIQWNGYPNETGLSLNNVPTDTLYTFIITDANGCVSSGGKFLDNNVYAYSQVLNSSPAICPNANGSITISISNSTNLTAPLTIHWENGQTGPTLSNVEGGTYSYWIEDSNGCTTDMYEQIVPSTSSFSVNGYSIASGCLVDTGAAWVEVIGGVAPYTFHWNQLSSNDTITGLADGTYSVNVIDAIGCAKNVQVVVPPASQFTPYISSTNTICTQSGGSATVNISNASSNAAPFSYLWSNGQTTQTINNLAEGYYSVTITDSQGCSKSLGVNINGIFNVNTSYIPDFPSCWLLADGSLNLPYLDTTGLTILWSNGDTGPLADSLAPGNHSVQISDNNGCFTSRTYNLPAFSYDCGCQLIGVSFVDENSNCLLDSNERTVPNALISVNNGTNTWSTFTDFNGRYQFYLLPGNYTLTETAPQYYHSSSCQPNPAAVTITGSGSTCIQNLNFPNTMDSVLDLSTWVINYGCAWLNHTMQQEIVVKNNGTIAVNGAENHVVHQNSVQYSPLGIWWNYDANTQTASINGFNIQPNQSFSNPLQYTIGANLALNQAVNFFDTVYTQVGSYANDNTPWNNYFYSSALTCNSYDPNYIEAQHRNLNIISENYNEIYPDSFGSIEMRYIIHFQNTGNYFAEKVVLVQQVDGDFVLESLTPEAGSHPFYASIDSNRNLIVTFPHIYLPDSASDPEGSQGWVSYSIKGLDPCFRNYQHSAQIYFDYNEAILTNTIETNVYCESIEEHSKKAGFLVYPNPSNNQIQLVSSKVGNKTEEFWISDIVGKVVLGPIQVSFDQNNGTTKAIDVSNLKAGMYIVSTKSNTFSNNGVKFIKE